MWSKVFAFTLSLLICFLLSPTYVQAQVIINEVMPAPSAGPEWIELLNTGDQSLSLEGWMVEDQLSSPTVIWQFSSQSLEPGQLILIELSSAKLNNAADGVTLKDQSGQVVDQMIYSSSQPDLSWSRSNAQSGQFVLATPTAGYANIAPTPTPAPSPSPTPLSTPSPSPSQEFHATSIEASEIMACPPTGENEWLEVKNTNSFLVNLDDWQVIDSVGNSRTVNLSLNPESLGVITWSSSLLNNSGDSVKLVDADGVAAFELVLGECLKGSAWIFEGGGWQLTSTPTPGQTNSLTGVGQAQANSQLSTAGGLTISNDHSADDSSLGGLVDSQSTSQVLSATFTPPIDPTDLVLSASASALTEPTEFDLNSPIDWQYGQRLDQLKFPILSVILGGLVLVAVGLYALNQLYDQTLERAHPSPEYLA